MSQDKKKVGSRWLFRSDHQFAKELNGREVEITRSFPPPLWDYVVKDEGGTWLAMDCELVPLGAAA